LRRKKRVVKKALDEGFVLEDNRKYNHFPNCPGVYVIRHNETEIKIGHSQNVSRRMNDHRGYRINNTLPNVILVLQSKDHA
jgi:hypothetical protein